MPFEIIEDVSLADIAFRASGSDLTELFFSCSEAILSVLISNPQSVLFKKEIRVELTNRNLDLLLFDFLQEFIYYKDAESLILLPKLIKISESNYTFFLECILYGEEIESARHKIDMDIKAVTMHKLSVEKNNRIWTAVFVVDV